MKVEKEKEGEKKSCPNLRRASPGCSHGGPIAQLGAVESRLPTKKAKTTPPAPQVPGTHKKRAESPVTLPPPRCPTLRRETQQRKGMMPYELTCSSRTAENGEEGSNSAHPAAKRPDLPLHTTGGGHVPPFNHTNPPQRRGVHKASSGNAYTHSRARAVEAWTGAHAPRIPGGGGLLPSPRT